ncbi:receptor activity-modifying protein 2-like [Tachysurus ichikawai]
MERIMTLLISTTLIICLAFTELHGSDDLLCDRARFDYGIYNICVPTFNENMATINYQDECPWPIAQRYYNNMDYCVQRVVKMTECTEPSLKNQIFLDLHGTYFLHCPYKKNPAVHLLLLFILPCIILTFLFPFFCSYITSVKVSSNWNLFTISF